MTREKRFQFLIIVGSIGGLAIALAVFAMIGPHRGVLPSPERIALGTLVVAIAMIWSCYFTVRAHFARDEFKRQREIAASFWGGWLGMAATAPVFFFIAAGGFGPVAGFHAPLLVFLGGYLLAPVFAVLGTVGAQLWLLYRDKSE
jgi:MFS family permease